MAINLPFADLVEDLNARLAPHGFALALPAGQGHKAVLRGAELDEVMKNRAFLNHGACITADSGIVLALSARGTELTLDFNFETILTATSYDPAVLAQALLEAGGRVLQRHRQFIAASNPLHRKLLEQREAITQAGFHLVPTHFVANFETRRELKRTTPERVDLIEVTLDGEGQLAATHLECAVARSIPFATALKVMGLGLVKA